MKNGDYDQVTYLKTSFFGLYQKYVFKVPPWHWYNFIFPSYLWEKAKKQNEVALLTKE